MIYLLILSVIICLAISLLWLFRNPSYENIDKTFIQASDADIKKEIPAFNLNYLVDKIAYSEPVYFPNGVETADFEEHLEAINLEIPNWDREGLYEVKASTKASTLDPAFLVYKWDSDTSNTLIFHHGASEYPFYWIFSNIFNKEILNDLGVNLIVVRTPFHKQKGALKQGTATLSTFMATMATSVKLTEKLIHTLRQKGVQTIEVGGFSLGAVITNRHRTIYNSADFYVPIVGTVAHEKFFIFPKKNITESELERNKIITHYLNFSAQWQENQSPNVFPVMARYDKFLPLNEHAPAYGNLEVEIWNTGHLSTALFNDGMRYVLLKRLKK
ncbi:hypothetical protein [Capnocytophaga felis]|uniref:hypothetical protein n=1 Tax=Capnocytophaga felis TaxID=2267611 RepID=UPI001D155E8E|nr:hypothetical protein [Capnocytophaga felis]